MRLIVLIDKHVISAHNGVIGIDLLLAQCFRKMFQTENFGIGGGLVVQFRYTGDAIECLYVVYELRKILMYQTISYCRRYSFVRIHVLSVFIESGKICCEVFEFGNQSSVFGWFYELCQIRLNQLFFIDTLEFV